MSNPRVYLSQDSKDIFDHLISALELSVSGKAMTDKQLSYTKQVLEAGKEFETSIKIKDDSWIGKTKEDSK